MSSLSFDILESDKNWNNITTNIQQFNVCNKNTDNTFITYITNYNKLKEFHDKCYSIEGLDDLIETIDFKENQVKHKQICYYYCNQQFSYFINCRNSINNSLKEYLTKIDSINIKTKHADILSLENINYLNTVFTKLNNNEIDRTEANRIMNTIDLTSNLFINETITNEQELIKYKNNLKSLLQKVIIYNEQHTKEDLNLQDIYDFSKFYNEKKKEYSEFISTLYAIGLTCRNLI